MVEWTDEESLRLIQLYQSKALLWDPSHPKYFKKSLKDDSWRDIAGELSAHVGTERSDADCKNKMVSLLASYRREKNKKKKSRKVPGSSTVYVSRWFAYEAFHFLNYRNQLRKRTNSETVDDSVDDDISAYPAEDEVEEEDVVTYDDPSFSQTYSPPPQKQPKTSLREAAASLTTASNSVVTRTASCGLVGDPAPDTDEMAAFFTYVTHKTKNYSPATKIGVQHAIFEILIQADRGMYEES